MEDANKRIEDYFDKVIHSNEYMKVEYLIFSIRKLFLDYLTKTRLNQFEIPPFLNEFVEYLCVEFGNSEISADEMLTYMLNNDVNGWINYYDTVFIRPYNMRDKQDKFKCDGNLFFLVLAGYILDRFRKEVIDIQEIVDNEKIYYETNQYGLTIVKDVEFKKNYFVYDNKAYLYNILTNISTIGFGDEMPAFATIITNKVKDGDILLRLDERLALPLEEAISYSTLDFEKYRGPQFKFNDTKFESKKTIIVHYDVETNNKLLMVIKKDFDANIKEEFLHIEIETLPYVVETEERTHCITTFLHGMYYPSCDAFTHIDYSRNQYAISDYIKKYFDSDKNVTIDFYSKKELHYKIWCIENGKYSREIWYDLMIVSLNPVYRKLLDEMLE